MQHMSIQQHIMLAIMVNEVGEITEKEPTGLPAVRSEKVDRWNKVDRMERKNPIHLNCSKPADYA